MQTISSVSLNGRANYGENYFSLATFYFELCCKNDKWNDKDENGEIENEDHAEQNEEEKTRQHAETSGKELDDSSTKQVEMEWNERYQCPRVN